MPKFTPTKQTPGQRGGSMPQKTSTGSGSRPTGAVTRTESTAPANPQKIRS